MQRRSEPWAFGKAPSCSGGRARAHGAAQRQSGLAAGQGGAEKKKGLGAVIGCVCSPTARSKVTLGPSKGCKGAWSEPICQRAFASHDRVPSSLLFAIGSG